MTDTNSTGIAPAAPKAPSALTVLLNSIKGQKAPNESDKKAIVNAFKKAMGKRAELQAALDQFDAESDATAIGMVKCYGSKQVEVNGVRYIPTSRGSRIYYKKMSDSPEVEKL
jgi:hypothetical protein